MNKIFIASLNQDEAKVLEAIPLAKEWSGKRLVKIIDTNFIYYERIENIAATKEQAIEILKNKNINLTNQIKELWNKRYEF